MNWVLPGTVIEAKLEDADRAQELFRSMFLPGGMVLGQVSNLSGLEPYMIQNWVKRGFLSPPKGKRYSLRQLCRILNINMLRGALPMEKICGLLTYVNGHLNDESDDLIDDSLDGGVILTVGLANGNSRHCAFSLLDHDYFGCIAVVGKNRIGFRIGLE